MMEQGNVKLRKHSLSDADDLARLANNSKVSRNLRDGFPHPYTREDAVAFIENVSKQVPLVTFGIEYKGEFAGNIGLSSGTDVYRKSAEIGYFLGEPFWNQGITTKAVQLMVHYAFTKLDLVRIHTSIFEYNVASQRVLEKCGFRQEGIGRKAVY
jgi:ribosomal-protein-alanine N-acetyltransferase